MGKSDKKAAGKGSGKKGGKAEAAGSGGKEAGGKAKGAQSINVRHILVSATSPVPVMFRRGYCVDQDRR